MKKMLITGSNGLLGQKLIYALLQRNQTKTDWDILATSRGENRMLTQIGYAYQPLDLTDATAVNTCFENFCPDVVIHTAAMTNVDACELDPDACQLQNVAAVANQLAALEKLKKTAYNPQFI
ncbi:MAG: sugar nucleotide-binding protein, partial [Bacteroidia bacterium]